jgi:hypothetical protein
MIRFIALVLLVVPLVGGALESQLENGRTLRYEIEK